MEGVEVYIKSYDYLCDIETALGFDSDKFSIDYSRFDTNTKGKMIEEINKVTRSHCVNLYNPQGLNIDYTKYNPSVKMDMKNAIMQVIATRKTEIGSVIFKAR